MYKHNTLLQESNVDFKNADHIIQVTFKIINDPKLMMTVVEKLHSSIIKSIDSLLYYDYLYKRISHIPTSAEDKLRLFRDYTIKKYNLKKEIIPVIKDLQDILEFRKRSPIEFVRKENLVICSSGYSTKTINVKKIKSYVAEIREFNQKINQALSK